MSENKEWSKAEIKAEIKKILIDIEDTKKKKKALNKQIESLIKDNKQFDKVLFLLFRQMELYLQILNRK